MRMKRIVVAGFMVLAAALALGPLRLIAGDNTFERTFTVSGPIRLELSNGSGSVEIRGSADGKVRIHGKVTGNWTLWGSAEKNVEEVLSNPPVEQKGDTIRIGKDSNWLKNVTIDYQIDVPHATEIDASVASGGVTVDKVQGPVKCTSASGYVHVYRVDRDTTVSAASGSIEVSGIGGIAHASTASGSINIGDVKGSVKANAASGSIRVTKPSDRVEISNISGGVEVEGASNDVRAHVVSGPINVSGNPSDNRLWDLKTVSGSVNVRVPRNASFLFSAEATSGDIRTSIPVVIEEQNKHSLRAHIGDSAGRVEVHTVSGSINVSSGT